MAELKQSAQSKANPNLPKPRLGDIVDIEWLTNMLKLELTINKNGKKYEGWERLLRFIKDGADTETKNFSDKTALMVAAKTGELEACESLLKMGAKTETKDKSGQTALMQAAHCGQYETCKLLIEKGADVNATDDGGCTPLMWAAKANSENICTLFLNNGAKLWARNIAGSSAMDFAKHNFSMDAYYTLVRHAVGKVGIENPNRFLIKFTECSRT